MQDLYFSQSTVSNQSNFDQYDDDDLGDIEHAFSIASNRTIQRSIDQDLRCNQSIFESSQVNNNDLEQQELTLQDWFEAYRQFYTDNNNNNNHDSYADYFIYKNILYIDKQTGNYHLCTSTRCDQLKTNTWESVCELTGNRYQLVHAALMDSELEYRKYIELKSERKVPSTRVTIKETNRYKSIEQELEKYMKIQTQNEYQDYLDHEWNQEQEYNNNNNNNNNNSHPPIPLLMLPEKSPEPCFRAQTEPILMLHDRQDNNQLELYTPLTAADRASTNTTTTTTKNPRKRKLRIKDINVNKLTKEQRIGFEHLAKRSQRNKQTIQDSAQLWIKAYDIIKWLLPGLEDNQKNIYAHDCVRYYIKIINNEAFQSKKRSYTFLHHVICCFYEMIDGYTIGNKDIIPQSNYVAKHLGKTSTLKQYKDNKIKQNNITQAAWILHEFLS
jgi:hypothetical protein